MGRIRSWVRRLERANQDNQTTILQKDGTIAKFSADATLEAFGHEAERFRAIHRGEDPGEAHPLTTAKRNAVHEQPFCFDADDQPRKKYRAE
ncbi:MAG: hypothetical protein H0T57_10480 [Rubrobacter sp.]|jgi:hypothetical protein|nr:hypothetical protein [Rubrobacter sp.]